MQSSAFKALVNGQFSLDLEIDQIKDLDVIPLKNKSYHILYKDESYKAQLVSSDFQNKKYTLRLGSTVYHVDLKDDLDALIKKMGYTLSSNKVSNTIHAPMPGILLDIKVQAGDQVKKGETLLILEAMKMENAILSPKDGVVKSIHSNTGDTVDKNKLLIELE